MPVPALLLLLASGLMHAVWNLLIKKAPDPAAHFAGAMGAALILYTPLFFLLVAPGLTAPPAYAWAAAAVTGVTEGVYLILLTHTYRGADLSLVYPVSRGSAPLFIVAGGVALLGERLSPLGYAGIGAVVVGIVVIAWPAAGARVTARAVGLSVLTGAAIAAHHVGYKWLFRFWPPEAAIYIVWLFTFSTLGGYVLLSRRGAAARYALRHLRSEVVVGVLAMFGFLLALWALDMSLVSYVGAARNVGILFGVLFGARLLGEGAMWQRLAGAAAIVAGVALMALA